MSQTMEGPREGVGAKLVWKGNDKVGSGTQVITASTPDRSMASDLDFGDMGTAKSLVTLTPEGGMTRATWAVDMDMGANPHCSLHWIDDGRHAGKGLCERSRQTQGAGREHAEHRYCRLQRRAEGADGRPASCS